MGNDYSKLSLICIQPPLNKVTNLFGYLVELLPVHFLCHPEWGSSGCVIGQAVAAGEAHGGGGGQRAGDADVREALVGGHGG